jgi:hypothetical protein
MLIDRELEAIVKCTEHFEAIDRNSRIRVLRYLADRFGLVDDSHVGFAPGVPPANLRASTTPDLTSKTTDANRIIQSTHSSDINANTDETDYEEVYDYPTLHDLLIKNYPKSEAEWMLCFGFYSSEFGTKTFSKDDVRERYREIDRYSKSNRNNFNNNLATCIRRDWFKSVNADKLILKEAGIEYANKIIEGKSEGKEKRVVGKRSRPANKNNTKEG